jgi:hypothetical protein
MLSVLTAALIAFGLRGGVMVTIVITAGALLAVLELARLTVPKSDTFS